MNSDIPRIKKKELGEGGNKTKQKLLVELKENKTERKENEGSRGERRGG